MAPVFDPDVLYECSKAGIGLPTEAAFDAVTAALDAAYPGRIYTGPRRWILNNAGGAMGQMTLLYGSLREYIIIFGTPIGTEGHSGRYGSEVWDWTFKGEMWCYLEGESERRVYGPGDPAYLGASACKGYRIPDHAWMLEYARGFIPAMLPFGLADTLVSTLDRTTLARTFVDYGKRVFASLRRGQL